MDQQTHRQGKGPVAATSPIVEMFVHYCRLDGGAGIAFVDADCAVVGLMLRRSVDVVARILGCWLAGAAYILIDPSTPAECVKGMLVAAHAKLLVVHEGAIMQDDAWKGCDGFCTAHNHRGVREYRMQQLRRC